MKEINIRTAHLSDAKQLLEIYAPYVEKTAVTSFIQSAGNQPEFMHII